MLASLAKYDLVWVILMTKMFQEFPTVSLDITQYVSFLLLLLLFLKDFFLCRNWPPLDARRHVGSLFPVKSWKALAHDVVDAISHTCLPCLWQWCRLLGTKWQHSRRVLVIFKRRLLSNQTDQEIEWKTSVCLFFIVRLFMPLRFGSPLNASCKFPGHSSRSQAWSDRNWRRIESEVRCKIQPRTKAAARTAMLYTEI